MVVVRTTEGTRAAAPQTTGSSSIEGREGGEGGVAGDLVSPPETRSVWKLKTVCSWEGSVCVCVCVCVCFCTCCLLS